MRSRSTSWVWCSVLGTSQRPSPAINGHTEANKQKMTSWASQRHTRAREKTRGKQNHEYICEKGEREGGGVGERGDSEWDRRLPHVHTPTLDPDGGAGLEAELPPAAFSCAFDEDAGPGAACKTTRTQHNDTHTLRNDKLARTFMHVTLHRRRGND